MTIRPGVKSKSYKARDLASKAKALVLKATVKHLTVKAKVKDIFSAYQSEI